MEVIQAAVRGDAMSGTSGGVELTDELIDRLAKEVKESYERLRSRRGRPPLSGKAGVTSPQVCFRVTPEVHEALKRYAAKRDVSVSRLVRAMIEDVLARDWL